jgi:fatty acid desaturase
LAEASGLLRYGLIIYLIIAYGLATLMYWITGIRLLWAVFFTTQSKGKRSRMLFIVAYILGSGVGLLLIVICIICTITPVWGIPYGQSVAYWLAYVGHSITQLFQSASFNATRVGKSSKTTSGSRERGTSTGAKTPMSMPTRSSSVGNTTSLSSSSSSSPSEESPDELA